MNHLFFVSPFLVNVMIKSVTATSPTSNSWPRMVLRLTCEARWPAVAPGMRPTTWTETEVVQEMEITNLYRWMETVMNFVLIHQMDGGYTFISFFKMNNFYCLLLVIRKGYKAFWSSLLFRHWILQSFGEFNFFNAWFDRYFLTLGPTTKSLL